MSFCARTPEVCLAQCIMNSCCSDVVHVEMFHERSLVWHSAVTVNAKQVSKLRIGHCNCAATARSVQSLTHAWSITVRHDLNSDQRRTHTNGQNERFAFSICVETHAVVRPTCVAAWSNCAEHDNHSATNQHDSHKFCNNGQCIIPHVDLLSLPTCPQKMSLECLTALSKMVSNMLQNAFKMCCFCISSQDQISNAVLHFGPKMGQMVVAFADRTAALMAKVGSRIDWNWCVCQKNNLLPLFQPGQLKDANDSNIKSLQGAKKRTTIMKQFRSNPQLLVNSKNEIGCVRLQTHALILQACKADHTWWVMSQSLMKESTQHMKLLQILLCAMFA